MLTLLIQHANLLSTLTTAPTNTSDSTNLIYLSGLILFIYFYVFNVSLYSCNNRCVICVRKNIFINPIYLDVLLLLVMLHPSPPPDRIFVFSLPVSPKYFTGLALPDLKIMKMVSSDRGCLFIAFALCKYCIVFGV